jgi:energy-coupling factor transporter ATP-binding protein EcfA2
MSVSQPRLRVFAGPNGSGKSTLKEVLPESVLGVYVNADEIEKLVRANGSLTLMAFSIEATAAELSDFLARSTLLQSQGLQADASRMVLQDGRVVFQDLPVNSYHASVCVTGAVSRDDGRTLRAEGQNHHPLLPFALFAQPGGGLLRPSLRV